MSNEITSYKTARVGDFVVYCEPPFHVTKGFPKHERRRVEEATLKLVKIRGTSYRREDGRKHNGVARGWLIEPTPELVKEIEDREAEAKKLEEQYRVEFHKLIAERREKAKKMIQHIRAHCAFDGSEKENEAYRVIDQEYERLAELADALRIQ
jgi:hypothetical protein